MESLLKHAQDLCEQGEFDEAYRIADKRLKQDPNNYMWLSVMSHILLSNDKPVLGYQLAKRVTQLAPKVSTGWLNLGVACRDMRLDKEALRSAKRALNLSVKDEQKSMACVNLSSVLVDTGEFEEAEGYCLQALALTPDSQKALGNLSFCQLGRRNWKEGWPNYRTIIGHDWRPRIQANGEPDWDCETPGTIYLYGEQGIGDQLSFASMLPDMQKWCEENDSRFFVEVDKKVAGVLQRSFPDINIYGTLHQPHARWKAEDAEPDFCLPMGQIGEMFRNTDEDFPGTPYLKADPDRVLQWKALFESKDKPVIGIAWSGGIPSTGSKFRRVDLEQLLPVLESVDAHWVSLQYKPASRDIERFKKDHPHIDIVEYPHGTLSNDYEDTVAMVAALDHVVAMHTSVVHVAGGLGVPCWTFVPKNSQWRYGTGDESYVWADSLRLLRQKETGQWKDLIEKTAGELSALYPGVPTAATGTA